MKVTFHKAVEKDRKYVWVNEQTSGREFLPIADKKISDWTKLTKAASRVFLESPFSGSIEVEGTPEEVIKKINDLIKCFEKV